MKQVIKFIENHELYQSTQPGFIAKHSISRLLIEFRDDIVKAMKKGEIIIATFADFSKAFGLSIIQN